MRLESPESSGHTGFREPVPGVEHAFSTVKRRQFPLKRTDTDERRPLCSLWMCIQSCPFHIIKAEPAAYHITIGGRRGRHPRVGYHIVTVKNPETVVNVIERVVKWVYRKAWSDSLLPDQLEILDFESFKKSWLENLMKMR